MVRMSFPVFTESDFLVFNGTKAEDKRYNNERGVVRDKLKIIQTYVDQGLERMGIHLVGKVSRHWPNPYNHYKVNGIWIGYSLEGIRYYEYPHLSIGIYNGFIFIGLEINARADKFQGSFAELIEQNPDYFLERFEKLDERRRVILFDRQKLNGSPTKDQLNDLSKKIMEQRGWLSVGVSISMNEYLENPHHLFWIILDVFEHLYPLVTILSQGDVGSKEAHNQEQDHWSEGDEYDEKPSVIHITERDIPRSQAHKILSRKFRKWIRENYSERIRKERNGIDVEFMLGDDIVCVELKTKSDGTVREQIRDALGQLFEYNYYPGREVADQWIIGTDTKPKRKDLEYVDTLQECLPRRLTLIWEDKTGFRCHPSWP